MGELVEIVDSLENKVSKLLHRLELLNQANTKLNEELLSVRSEQDATKQALIAKKKSCENNSWTEKEVIAQDFYRSSEQDSSNN